MPGLSAIKPTSYVSPEATFSESTHHGLPVTAWLLEKIIENIKLGDQEQQVKVIFSSAGPSREIVLDVNRITQVFYNLLMNAIRYTMPGGSVTVRVEGNQQRNGLEYAVISITDTGIGIEQELLPHVFERFYRVEASRSRDTGGMGLG
jgi:two-component system sensor histidine kinase BaeS